jgi:putative copper export protein/methionine-rich copper-binding protein CopC
MTLRSLPPSALCRRTPPTSASPGNRATHPARLRTFLVTCVAAIAALLGLTAAPAAAVDNSLLGSTPQANATVDVSPTTLTLQFASPLGPTNNVTMTCGAEGQPAAVVTLGKPLVLADQLTLSVPVSQVVPKGVCNVVWRVTDLNLQPAGSSSFSFVIANDTVVTTTTSTTVVGATPDAAVTATTTAETDQPDTSGAGASTGDADGTTTNSSGPLGLFRWFSNMSLGVLFGALVLIALAWPNGVEFVQTQKFLLATWLIAGVSAFLFTGALAADISGASIGSIISPTGWGALLDSAHGKAAIIRFVFVVATVYAVRNPTRVVDPGYRLQALGIPLIAVFSTAFNRPEFGPVEWLAGGVHAVAMATWFGGLVLLTRVVLVWPGEEDLVQAVRGYAKYSMPALVITVVTGVVLMFRLDRGSLGSNHGIVLIIKTLLVALMVFVGVAARQFIGTSVGGRRLKRTTVARLRRALGIEAIVGVVVLAVTSWLLALTPLGLAQRDQLVLDLGPAHRFTSTDGGVDVLVAFSEKVGLNDVRIEVTKPEENLSGLQIDFLPPSSSSVVGVTVDPAPLTGAGVAVLEKIDGLTLNSSGTWTVVVRVGTTEVARQQVFVGEELATPPTS